jgi:putative ABC transport system permease protein
MIKNYLLITVRSMMKNRLFIIVNVLGMGAAIACCIVSYFAYTYDATFDRNHEQINTIYRVSTVREVNNTTTHDGYAPLPLGNITAKTMADVHQSILGVAIQLQARR